MISVGGKSVPLAARRESAGNVTPPWGIYTQSPVTGG